MMPIMTTALRTLRGSEAARGSKLLNIVQQIASSVGVALMSVLWASLSDHPAIPPEHRILSLPALAAAAHRARNVTARSAAEFRASLGLKESFA